MFFLWILNVNMFQNHWDENSSRHALRTNEQKSKTIKDSTGRRKILIQRKSNIPRKPTSWPPCYSFFLIFLNNKIVLELVNKPN